MASIPCALFLAAPVDIASRRTGLRWRYTPNVQSSCTGECSILGARGHLRSAAGARPQEPCRRRAPLREVIPRAGGPLLDSLMTLPHDAVTTSGPLLGDMIARPDEALGIQLPLFLQLAGLLLVNILGVQAVGKALQVMQDRNDQLSVVKIQLGLLKDHNELQHRLAQLSGMIQLGQQGIWLVLEESILEINKHRGACAYAATSLTSLTSKHEAYELFGRMAKSNLGKAQEEEQLASHEFDGSDGSAPASGSSAFDWIMGRGAVKDEAMVITLLVACRGNLDIPSSVASWQDVQHALQQLCSLSSDKLMAIELLWTPHDEGSFLTRQQMVQDYKELQPIR